MSFANYELEDQRLRILEVLAQDGAYSHNETVIHRALAALGHQVSADALHTQLAWLAEQGLVTTEEVGTLLVATLTRRGDDVANGRAKVPGVARPRPGR